MRISDWSSDVCSSDLRARYARSPRHQEPAGTPCRRSLNTSFFSPGAAGKLLHILVEGLRRELQAFDHRPVGDRKSVLSGKSVSVRLAIGGRRIITKNKKPTNHSPSNTNQKKQP